jgi:hypothetical protein
VNVSNRVVDVWFVVDFFLTFVVGYFDEWGILVTDKKMISERYMKTNFPTFIADLIGCIPLEIVAYALGYGNGDRITSILRFPRIFRFHRLYTSEKLLSTHIVFRLARLLTGLVR